MVYKSNSTINMEGFQYYVKKPIPISAKKISDEFYVETLEGIMKGKAGDYLIVGVKGELYPCDREVFEETYEPHTGDDVDV